MNHPLEPIFTTQKLRLTEPRKLIFNALDQSEHPLSIAHLTRACPTIDPASVYRTVQLFMKIGVVEAVPLGWKSLYELALPYAAHHHHLTCTVCGKLVDLELNKLERMIESIAKENDFSVESHQFEIKGVCDDCRHKTGSPTTIST